jgi:regulatory protein
MWRKPIKKIADEDRVVRDEMRSRERTMARALRLLAAKPRSTAELRERLLEKAWTNASIVGDVIGKLEEYKYLDDKEYACGLALAKLRQKPQGKRKLQQALSQKKLEKATVDDAIEAVFETMPESELIGLAIDKRLKLKGKPRSREDLKKFYDHLMRQGFSYGLIREKLAEVDGAIGSVDENTDAE